MIQGHWKLICGEANGQDEPEEDIERSSLVIVGNQHAVTVGAAVMKGTHTLDPSQHAETVFVSEMGSLHSTLAEREGAKAVAEPTLVGHTPTPTAQTGGTGESGTIYIWGYESLC